MPQDLDASGGLARIMFRDLHALVPTDTTRCWMCGNMKCWGTNRCEMWVRHTGLATGSVMCFRDGGNHSMAEDCPRMTVPKGFERCYSCLLPQQAVFGCSFHSLAREEQTAHCNSMRDRQFHLLLWFLRSSKLRIQFFATFNPYVSWVPKWRESSGGSLNADEVQDYFSWLWTPVKTGYSLFNVDTVLVFMYKAITVPSVRKPVV